MEWEPTIRQNCLGRSLPRNCRMNACNRVPCPPAKTTAQTLECARENAVDSARKVYRLEAVSLASSRPNPDAQFELTLPPVMSLQPPSVGTSNYRLRTL